MTYFSRTLALTLTDSSRHLSMDHCIPSFSSSMNSFFFPPQTLGFPFGTSLRSEALRVVSEGPLDLPLEPLLPLPSHLHRGRGDSPKDQKNQEDQGVLQEDR
mmetsp:Transcript_937/g.2021  ORF Transcript_937/g.2021 Transcript_937/m.2021 type:complete len:102 (-) Transcript_937:464-769(-)